LTDISEYREPSDAEPVNVPMIFMADEPDSAPANLDHHHILFRPISPETLSLKVAVAFETGNTTPTDNQSGAQTGAEEKASPAYFMRRALDLCTESISTSAEGPFAAVIVRSNKIVAEACDRVIETGDPTAKAVLLAIRSACQNLHSPVLNDCEIFLSCEPCPMGLAAIYEAGIDRVYYATMLEDIENGLYSYLTLYDQMARKTSERTMPMIEFLNDEGHIVLQQWKDLQDS
jgi:tRNA(Arg) A34 adenosine deaminase TadA